ncbi:MAG: biosynthetic arginine decarboxylase [Bradymonadia bacterium]
MNDQSRKARWGVEQSAELYNIGGWGDPYFTINTRGHVQVTPDPEQPRSIDLYALINDLKARGLDLPMLIRFSDIIRHRIRTLNECFNRAIEESDYQGVYRGVFPVKVNQQRHVVDEIVSHGRAFSFGLECGSKPELLIALSAMTDPDGLIICNGYKDEAYIETALLAQQFGKTVVIVLERIEELDLVFQASKKLGIKPILGVRARLSTKGMGRWAESTGDRAKFGLSSSELVEAVDRLAARGMVGSLALLHFHIGSQISSILPIKSALKEAANIFVELARMGCPMRYLDVGGGLGIDYDGSHSNMQASVNYSIQEYAYDVVSTVNDACARANLTPPTLVSESGRAVVAHQSVLVFDVLGTNAFSFGPPARPAEDAPLLITQLWDTLQGINDDSNLQEVLHDAVQARHEAQSLFTLGYLTLRQKAHVESLFWHCAQRLLRRVRQLEYVPEELQVLESELSSIYYCNFSVFQSAPDAWAIDQLFPIMPLHRLAEEPTVRATLADLTCDSDGAISTFIDREGHKPVLELHPIQSGQPYYVAMFLVGAYQEILGDLHNLFGDTNAVHVRTTDYGYEVAHVVKGDSIQEVLHYVQYDPEDMVERVRRQAETALNEGRLTLPQVRLLMRHYESSLGRYTYLNPDDD